MAGCPSTRPSARRCRAPVRARPCRSALPPASARWSSSPWLRGPQSPRPGPSSLLRPMAQIAPLPALRYDQDVAGPLQELWSPPYDVIDAEGRAALAARSPYNAVHVDLPEGDDPYAAAAETLRRWEREGAVVREEPAIWALEQDSRAPDGRGLVRRGFLARVRVEEYGTGRNRPLERPHPGPKEDRIRLQRATRANLSPIFSLFSDPGGRAAAALAPHTEGAPWGEVT